MKRILKVVFLFLCIFVVTKFSIVTSAAATVPETHDNLTVGLKSTSELVATDDGYMRVFYDEEKIGIEYYDNNFTIKSKKKLAMELDIWGGFYAGKDAYYIVEGKLNTAESDTAEVIRVIKYDKSWKRLGAATITGNNELFGGEVRIPFDYGCVEMTEYGETLYIVTAHEGYVDPAYNQGHQGFLMIAVNKNTMSGEIVKSDLWHSFAQYITNKNSDLYVLEQSEGSRYTCLSRINSTDLETTKIPVLEYGGSRDSAWAVSCYASVDGLELSSNNVLSIGTSIDQTTYDSVTSDTAHNIYLTVTPMNDFTQSATTVKWLTNYSGNGKSFLGVKIVKINDNRFMILWEEYGTSKTASINDSLSESILHYIFVDGNGNTISKEFTASAPISDCEPIVKGSNVVYYASNPNMVNFYKIDTSTGAFSKKAYRVAGDNVSWNLKNGIVTLSGKGKITLDVEGGFRRPISSCSGSYVYSSGDNVWKSIRDRVKKIVIETGITSISDNAFNYFDNLTEVQIKSGVKTIGKEAFSYCNSLEKITIPDTVTKIGTDFLWTGYYWIHDESHVVRATIYTPFGSYAGRYAKQNNINYKLTKTSVIKGKVTGIKTKYVYNGKSKRPTVKLVVAGKTLVRNTDYTVSYKNNVKIGKAQVIIKGKGKYSGTITKSFSIIPKQITSLKVRKTKTTAKTKNIRITWKKDSKVSGYQIEYAQNSRFTKNKKSITIKKNYTTSKIVSKLSRKRRYYIRVRSYKTVNGKRYYGNWKVTSYK